MANRDWDKLIDDVEGRARAAEFSSTERNVGNLHRVRTALREAIDEVVKERETLAAQLAEANADAERLANQWVVFGQKCCSYCGAPVRWNIDDSNPIAKHAPDCPIELHRARVGKGE